MVRAAAYLATVRDKGVQLEESSKSRGPVGDLKKSVGKGMLVCRVTTVPTSIVPRQKSRFLPLYCSHSLPLREVLPILPPNFSLRQNVGIVQEDIRTFSTSQILSCSESCCHTYSPFEISLAESIIVQDPTSV